jgi:sugar/nucleoside kinase (ribokinase family)
MIDIITIGSATRDVFLSSKDFQVIQSEKFAGGAAECVTLGAKIEVEDCTLSTGGGATNAAATFASLGFSTGIVAKLGDDEPGRDILADLLNLKIETSLVKKVKNGRTAYSTLLTTTGGERTALVYRGVSGEFAASDVPLKSLKCSWLYVSSLSGNIDLLAKLVAHAKKMNIRIAINPGGGELSKAPQLRQILAGVDVILVNLEEAQLLSGMSTKDGKELAGALAKLSKVAVVTDGGKGAYAAQAKSRYYAKNRGIKSLSRTGAGDAFGSGCVAAIAKGLSLENALQLGTLNAESVIQHIGAKKGILTKWPKEKELEEIKVFVSRV